VGEVKERVMGKGLGSGRIGLVGEGKSRGEMGGRGGGSWGGG